MDLNKEFLRNIEEAFASQQEQVRTQAHTRLLHIAGSDSALTVRLAMEAFGNEALAPATRVRVATFLAGVLMPKDRENLASIWPKLTSESKEAIKSGALKQLIDPNAGVMRAAASLIAAVFALDCISDRAWEQLLPVLTDNVENSDLKVQKAAVTCLGYVCDLLNKNKITDLSDGRVDSLLAGICKGLRGYNDLTETAIQALEDSLQFLKKKIDNEQIAYFVMELLIKLLREVRAAPTGIEAERKLIYCLTKISRMLFAQLNKYYTVLYPEVLNSYKRGDAGVLIACNYFFSAMIKLEERHRTNYMIDYWKGVMEVCLKWLAEATDVIEEDEGASSSTVLSVLETMAAINRLHADITIQVIQGFITNYIDIPSEEKKIAALIAFESMIEMPRSDALLVFVDSGFYGILNFLQNGTIPIRRAANRLLLRIIRHLPEIFLSDVNFHRGTKVLLQIMQSSPDSEAGKSMQYNTATMFSELTLSAKAVPSAAVLLRSLADQLFEIICNVVLTSESLTVIDSYFSVIFDFLQRVIEPKNLGEYLINFSKYLKTLRERPHRHQLSLYEFLFINMTVIITQLKKSNVRFFSNGQNPTAFLTDLYKTIIEIFTALKAPVSEGLMLMATILTCEPTLAQSALPSFLTEYIAPALRDCENTDLFKSAIDSVSVCCKAFEGQIEGFVREIYGYFLSLLSRDVVQKELKITIFFALSDFVLHCPKASQAHLQDMITLAEMALQAVVHFQGSDQEDLVEYAEAFKETLVDFYLCLIHGIYLKFDEGENLIEQSMRKVTEFIRLTSADRLNPTISYQNNCLGLLVDFYGKKKAPATADVGLISTLYKSLQKHEDYGDVNGTLEYTKKYFSAL